MARAVALLMLASTAALALPAPDPMASPECRVAREALEAALADEGSTRQARSQRIERARSQVALACLGPMRGKPERSGAPQPAQRVPPPVISVEPAVAPPPSPAAPPPPLEIARPTVITTCDPTGCWDTEGRRLNQTGPLLIGPRGVCNLQGGVVNCP